MLASGVYVSTERFLCCRLQTRPARSHVGVSLRFILRFILRFSRRAFVAFYTPIANPRARPPTGHFLSSPTQFARACPRKNSLAIGARSAHRTQRLPASRNALPPNEREGANPGPTFSAPPRLLNSAVLRILRTPPKSSGRISPRPRDPSFCIIPRVAHVIQERTCCRPYHVKPSARPHNILCRGPSGPLSSWTAQAKRYRLEADERLHAAGYRLQATDYRLQVAEAASGHPLRRLPRNLGIMNDRTCSACLGAFGCHFSTRQNHPFLLKPRGENKNSGKRHSTEQRQGCRRPSADPSRRTKARCNSPVLRPKNCLPRLKCPRGCAAGARPSVGPDERPARTNSRSTLFLVFLIDPAYPGLK